jgi:hypothetical protein
VWQQHDGRRCRRPAWQRWLPDPGRILGDVSKGRRRSGPKIRYVQPGYRFRAPAAAPGPVLRAAGLSPAQVLEKITRAGLARDQVEAELAALTDHAVSLGVSWPEIARRLGVSRQAARQDCQRRHREDAGHGRDDAAA